jgi:RNA polymerase sigma factor (sigma-70 family)
MLQESVWPESLYGLVINAIMDPNADNRSGDLIARWRAGDQEAAAELFRRYVDRLIALARSRLSAKLARRVDPEDVVHSAYRSFFAGAQAGRFDVQRGGDLWRLLVAMTLHKLYRQVRRNQQQKRAVEREQSFGSEESLGGLESHMLTHQPSPVEAVALADQLEQALQSLKPQYRVILELRLQGYTIAEIAVRLKRSERRVYRILESVKEQLEQDRRDDPGGT